MALSDYALSTLANANRFLGLTADGGDTDNYVELLVNRASEMVENYCNRKFKARLYTKERHNGTGQKIVYFDNPPVLSVCLDELVWTDSTKRVTRSDGGSFVTDGFSTGNNKVLVQNSDSNSGLKTLTAVNADYLTFSDTIATDSEDNNVTISEVRSLWVGDDGVDKDNFDVLDDHIYYSAGFSEGHGNIKLTYYGGYKTIPDDLEQACLEVVQIFYEGNQNIGNIQRERLGDHDIMYGTDSDRGVLSNVTMATKTILDKYRRIAV